MLLGGYLSGKQTNTTQIQYYRKKSYRLWNNCRFGSDRYDLLSRFYWLLLRSLLVVNLWRFYFIVVVVKIVILSVRIFTTPGDALRRLATLPYRSEKSGVGELFRSHASSAGHLVRGIQCKDSIFLFFFCFRFLVRLFPDADEDADRPWLNIFLGFSILFGILKTSVGSEPGLFLFCFCLFFFNYYLRILLRPTRCRQDSLRISSKDS